MADNGHVLSSGGLRLDGTDHLWVPTTWVVLPDEVQPVHGATRCGIVSLMFAAGTPARAEFHRARRHLAEAVLHPDLPMSAVASRLPTGQHCGPPPPRTRPPTRAVAP